MKKELSIEEIERQALLELPDRKLMALLQGGCSFGDGNGSSPPISGSGGGISIGGISIGGISIDGISIGGSTPGTTCNQ